MESQILLAFHLRLLKKSRYPSLPSSIETDHTLDRFRRRQSQKKMQFIFLLLVSIVLSKKVHRHVWMRTRSSHFWEYIINRTFSDKDWYENFRIRRHTFKYLCEKLRPHIEKETTRLRYPISVELRVAVTLWFLATSTDYRTLSHLFGISKASVCMIVREVCRAIVENLTKQYIKIPNGNELRNMITSFKEKFGFPSCGGALDGSHIPISAPVEHHTDYYNRKGFYSIVLQGLVDHRYCFIDVYTGWPGSVHDARVFSQSSLFNKGKSGTLFPNWMDKIGDTDVPIVILGDSAYPLLNWLMKPFPHKGALTQGQKKYNYKLSSARVVSENAFGRLKARWRCLSKRIDVAPENIPVLIIACCTLHNICEIHGDEFIDEWMSDMSTTRTDEEPTCSPTLPNNSAEVIRNAFVNYFDQY